MRPAAVVGLNLGAGCDGGVLFGGSAGVVADERRGGEVDDRAEVDPVALDGGLAFGWVVGEESGVCVVMLVNLGLVALRQIR